MGKSKTLVLWSLFACFPYFLYLNSKPLGILFIKRIFLLSIFLYAFLTICGFTWRTDFFFFYKKKTSLQEKQLSG